MGLDMYLRANKYASGYTEPETVKAIASIVEAIPLITDSNSSAEVSLTVGYWRKANAIHNWFMQLTDIDNCRPVYVRRNDLIELMSICSQVLAAKDDDLSSELLPTASGFFFGGTNYDEYYYHNLEYTYKLIDNLLENTDDTWSFEYQASW